MAQEVGTAYVTVMPSTKGFGKKIESEIGGGVEGGTKKGGTTFLGSVGKWVKRAGIAGAAITAGFAIKGGISRVMQIDQAEAKLRGFGFSSEQIAGITKDATAAVKGTAFGLGEAMGLAAQAMGAGVKPGQELTKYMKMVTGAAAASGRPLNEMGVIFGKIQAKGKVSMEEINQLMEAGVVSIADLAKAYGVSGEQFTKMVSKGEIDAASFQKVVGDRVGSVADEMGKTFQGKWANFQAALSRLGEKMLKPIIDALGPALDEITTALEPMEEVFKELGPIIGDVVKFGIDLLVNAFKLLLPVLKVAVGALKVILAVVRPLAPVLAALAIGFVAIKAGIAVFNMLKTALIAAKAAMFVFNLVVAANPIGLIITAVAALVAGLIWFFTQTEAGKKIIEVVWGAIKTVVGGVVKWFQTSVLPIIRTVWNTVSTIFKTVFNAIKTVVSTVFNFLKAYFTTMFNIYKTIFTTAWNAVWTVVSNVWNWIQSKVKLALAAVKLAINGAKAVIGNIGKWFGDMWNKVKAAVENVVKKVGEIKSKVTTALSNAKTWLVNAGKNIIGGIINGVGQKLSDAKDKVFQVKDKVQDALSKAKDWLINAGKNIIRGLIDGIGQMFQSVKDKLGELTSKLKDWKGPPKKDRKLLVGAGKLVIGGFIDGLVSERSSVRKTLEGYTGLVEEWSPGAADLGISGGSLNRSVTHSLLQSAAASRATFQPQVIVKIGERELEQISQEQAAGVFNYIAGLTANRQVAV